VEFDQSIDYRVRNAFSSPSSLHGNRSKLKRSVLVRFDLTTSS
jgi:hypothetical protein